MNERFDVKALVGEFTGTMMLVLVGCGAIVMTEQWNWPGHLGISIAFGAIVTLMILSFAKLSGAHINPAVTIAGGLFGSFERKKIIPYLLYQGAGAIAGAIILQLLFPKNLNLGSTSPHADLMNSFLIEFAMTFALMATILITARQSYSLLTAALLIGLCVGLEAYFGGPYTGASMNPARSLGPALVSGMLYHQWIYIFAPILGAITASLIFKLFKW